MTDRELLELAAKAAGIDSEWREIIHSRVAEYKTIKHTKTEGFWSAGKWWNPLTDDGDALRLAVKLEIVVEYRRSSSATFAYNYARSLEIVENNRTLDPYAATRRAIVRAAAEIGRTKT